VGGSGSALLQFWCATAFPPLRAQATSEMERGVARVDGSSSMDGVNSFGAEHEPSHPTSFNVGPAWLQEAQGRAAALVSQHGYLLLALAVAIFYLWPTYATRIKRWLFPDPPKAAASGITSDSAGSSSQDCHAEERRAAVLKLQQRLDEETAQKLAERKAQEETQREQRLAALEVEAKRLGFETETGQALGGRGASSASRPVTRIAPARPATSASRSGYNPLSGTGGGGSSGFRSTRNAGRGG